MRKTITFTKQLEEYDGVSGSGKGTARLRLSTKEGLIGYKIKRFELITAAPYAGDNEHIVQIFSVEPGNPSELINFNDPTLLGAAITTLDTSGNGYHQIVRDDKVVNQDLYVTHVDRQSSGSINFLIELEIMPLDINEATVATLRDMRGRE
jgi:hypothetical protein